MIIEPFIFWDALEFEEGGLYIKGLSDRATPEQVAAFKQWQEDVKEAKKNQDKL